MAAADSVAAITKLAKQLSEVVASVKAKEIEYNDIDRFASAKDGLVRVFQMNQYAECFRECGVDSRQGLSEYVEQLSSNGAGNVKKAYESLLESEEQHNAYVEGVNGKLESGNSVLLSNMTEVGGIVPDIMLTNAGSNTEEGLLSILQSSNYTVLVLIRHYG